MPKDRSVYRYQRLTKPETHPPEDQDRKWLTSYSVIQELTGHPPAPGEREEIFQILAKAERLLYLQTEEREYQVNRNNPALRLNNLGVRQLQNGNFPAAFRSLMDAIDLDKTLALAYNNLGLMYLEIGDLDQAIEHFDQAIGIQENLDIAHGNRGLALLESGRFRDSYDNLRRALDMAPGDPMHHNNLGLLCLELNRIQLRKPHVLQ